MYSLFTFLKHIRVLFLLTLCLCSFNGCLFLEKVRMGATKNAFTVNHFRQAFLEDNVRKIYVAPVYPESPDWILDQKLIKEFKHCILQMNPFHWEFSPYSYTGELPPDLKIMSPENMDIHFFNEAVKQGCDAVLFCHIKAWRSYKPMRLDIKIELVSVQTGDVLWWVEDDINMAQNSVSGNAREWYISSYHPSVHPVLKEKAVMLSPEVFLQYAWSTCVNTIRSSRNE